MVCLLAANVRKIHVRRNGRRVATLWRSRSVAPRIRLTGRWASADARGMDYRIFYINGREETCRAFGPDFSRSLLPPTIKQ